MCQSRYCRRRHSGISSNITNTTHFVRHPRHLRQHTAHLSHTGAPSLCHVTIARRPGNRPQHVTHTGTLPRLARHKCKHIIHASAPPTQVHHPRHPRQHKQHAISQTSGYPIELLKILALKFQEEILQFLLLVFIFPAFTLSAFLNIFIEVWKTLTEKRFQRKLVCLIQNTTIFSKTIAQIFQKKLFPNVSVVLAILYILSLKKQFTKNQLPLL